MTRNAISTSNAEREKPVISLADTILITTKEAAVCLGVQPTTLEIWRSTGRCGPPFIRIGRAVRYKLADLDAWVAARTVDSRS